MHKKAALRRLLADQRVGSGGVVVPVVPEPVVPVVPVPVAPAPVRVVPVPEVSVVPVMPEVELPDEVPVALLPEVRPDVLPEVDEPLVPEVDAPLVESAGLLFMPEVPLGPRHVSVPPVVPVAPVPLVALLPVPISVELDPADVLVPEVLRSWLPVLCCWFFLALDFFVSVRCWSPLVLCEPVAELPDVVPVPDELPDCAATPALTNIAARITASLVFITFLLLLMDAYGELAFWHRANASRVGEHAVRQSELPQAK